MKEQKGITLVALIITIIVMIILAGVSISLVSGDNGILNKAEVAGEKQNYATLEERIKAQSVYITQGENVGKVDLTETEKNIRNMGLEEIKNITSSPNSLTVELNDGNKLEIEGANGRGESGELNEYGFLYDAPYVCDKFWESVDGEYSIEIKSNHDFVIKVNEKGGYKEGGTCNPTGIDGVPFTKIESIKYGDVHTGVGACNSQCKAVIDENGNLLIDIIINSENVKLSSKKIELIDNGNAFVFIDSFSEDGKMLKINYNGIEKAFSVQN